VVKVSIRLDNRIRIQKECLPSRVIALLEKRLIFKNPLFYANEKYGRPNFGIEPTLRCIWEDKESGDLVITRGFGMELIRIFHKNRVEFEIEDLTQSPDEVSFTFQGAPYGYQVEAWQELNKHRFGVLVGPLGSGKKVLALNLVARRKVPALVIVKTKRELYQWKEIAMRFLGLEAPDVGLIGDGYRELGKRFTIGITLTFYKLIDELKAQTGFLILDQCDKANLKVLFKASLFDCPYQLGLARASKRSDGLTRLMYAYLGPKISEIWPENGWTSFKGLAVRPILRIKSTSFTYDYQDDWSEMINALCQDQGRNKLILADILQETADPTAKALVISERVSHLEDLLQQIKGRYSDGVIITGDTSNKERAELTRRFDLGKFQIILVTFKSIPAIEVRKVNRLFVVSPVKFDAHIIQIIGKMLGTGQQEKQPEIFEYRDEIKLLQASAKRRLKIYKSMGVV